MIFSWDIQAIFKNKIGSYVWNSRIYIYISFRFYYIYVRYFCNTYIIFNTLLLLDKLKKMHHISLMIVKVAIPSTFTGFNNYS